MEDKLSQNGKTNGKSKNGHDSRNEEEPFDDLKMQDEPIERKRQKMCDDSFVIHEPVQTQNEVEMESSFSDQTSYDVQPSCSYSPPGPSFKDLEINMKQIQQITGSAHPIESQTFWNTNYKDDLDSSVFMNPLSVIQNYPSTELSPSTSQGFSASDMLQPEMEMIPISLSEATIQCPLCQLYFAPYQIEIHASSCMEQQ